MTHSIPPPFLSVPALQQQLREAGIAFRDPPAEPTTCCGRGCNGCVWESHGDALAWWKEDAQAQLAAASP
ncbi:MAG: oxidoreductase-like domain-containing protein [Polaromonas sp.]|nr:oxidoreductase-like domain-containing protein [Polaromonas sp.]